MSPFLYVLLITVVSAIIGGVTNHIAIKMLFHPRKPLYLFGRKLPFTPGLIPKRKEEIGASLGRVVSSYLVTSSGLKRVIGKPEISQRAERTFARYAESWLNKEETVEQLAVDLMGAGQVEAYKRQLLSYANSKSRQMLEHIWETRGVEQWTAADLMPDWSEDKREALAEWITEYLLKEIQNEMASPEINRMIHSMIKQFIEQSSGFFGALAGMFVDEDRMVAKIRAVLAGRLNSPEIRRVIHDLLLKRIARMETMRLTEVLEAFTNRPAKEWLFEQAESQLQWAEWLERGAGLPLREILAGSREAVMRQVPAVTALLLGYLERHADHILEAVELPKLVEHEVKNFPVERLEEILLSVSGKEFKAITWLGVLLGGFIGLLQALLLLWIG